MGKLSVFNFVTLNGYFKGPKEDISWHRHGGEEAEFSENSLNSGNTLLFGRKTYEMMESFWTSQMASENFPVVAKGMNKSEKIVFSTTLKKAEWSNTKLVKKNIVKEIKKMKKIPGKNLTILGSGSILTQFAEQGLIDEYQIMVDPVVIPKGTSIFKGIQSTLSLKLTSTRTFKSGVVLLCYQPMDQ